MSNQFRRCWSLVATILCLVTGSFAQTGKDARRSGNTQKAINGSPAATLVKDVVDLKGVSLMSQNPAMVPEPFAPLPLATDLLGLSMMLFFRRHRRDLVRVTVKPQ